MQKLTMGLKILSVIAAFIAFSCGLQTPGEENKSEPKVFLSGDEISGFSAPLSSLPTGIPGEHELFSWDFDNFGMAMNIAVSDDGVFVTGGETPLGKDDTDIYVKKFDFNGDELWHINYDSLNSGYEGVQAIDVSQDGSYIYVVGSTSGLMDPNYNDPDPSNGDMVLLVLGSQNGDVVNITQRDQAISGVDVVAGREPSNNVYVVASTWNFSSGRDVFYGKFDSTGFLIEGDTFGTNEDDYVWGITVDSEEGVYVAGSTTGEMVSGNNPNHVESTFIKKYDEFGGWTRQLVSSNLSSFTYSTYKIASDGSNNIYVLGATDTGEFPPYNPANFVLIKYDQEGMYHWTKIKETETDDYPFGIAIDNKNNIYLVGASLSENDSDGMILKLDSNGDELFSKHIDIEGWMNPNDAAVDSLGNLYFAGDTGSFETTESGAFMGRMFGSLEDAPSSPSDLHAMSERYSVSINLNWSDNSENEDGFRIERSLTGFDGSFEEIAQLPADSTSFIDGGLEQKTTYFYRVRAINFNGFSLFTDQASATTGKVLPPRDDRPHFCNAF